MLPRTGTSCRAETRPPTRGDPPADGTISVHSEHGFPHPRGRRCTQSGIPIPVHSRASPTHEGQDPHNTVQHLQMPQGAVYIYIPFDKGGRAQVNEIDQPPADASQFLCKLRQLAADSDPRWTFKS